MKNEDRLRRINWINILQVYLLVYPLVLPISIYATWLVGRLSLGYWPRPSLDDPKEIGLLVDIAYYISGVLIIVMPVFAIGLLGLLYRAYRDKAQQLRLFLVSMSSLTLMVATIIFLRSDPLKVMSWYMD